MSLTLFLRAGKIFRSLPHFKGKFRLAKLTNSLLFSRLKLSSTHAWVRMKDGFFLKLSLVNQTDSCAFWCGIYDSNLIKRFVGMFEDNWVVLDVGANIGYYAIPFSLFGKGQVYAFEPLTSNFFHLQEAIARNNCRNIHAFNIGLGESDDSLGIMVTEKGTTGNAVMLRGGGSEAPTTVVKVESLDNFYKREMIERCDFIKLDIEGFEVSFLKGSLNVINTYRPIIFGEFNSYWLAENGHSLEDVSGIFSRLGYAFFKLSSKDYFLPVEHLLPNMENILLVPKEKLAWVLQFGIVRK